MEDSWIVDYLAFAAFIFGSFVILQWDKLKSKMGTSKSSGSSSSNVTSTIVSIARSTLGVKAFLGSPSELYYHGAGMYETLYGMVLAYPIIAYVLVPAYYNSGTTSVYQYLDMRFKSKLVRCLASVNYIIRSTLSLGIKIYAPCVVLKTFIGLPVWVSICGAIIIAVILNLVDTVKKPLVFDVIEGVMMIGISIVIVVYGTFEVGGISNVIDANKKRGRLDFLNFDMDPTVRVSTTSAILGTLCNTLSSYGCQQNYTRRYRSMKNLKEVKRTLWTAVPFITVLFTLSYVVGMVIFATYADCDPQKNGKITKNDEIVAYYIEDKFGSIPGLLGIILAVLFSGSLTSTISNLNSLTLVTYEDFVKYAPVVRDLNDVQKSRLMIIITISYGFLLAGGAFLVKSLSGVIESSLLVTAITAGPLLGVFLLAMLAPCANWKGAAAGMIASYVVTICMAVSRISLQLPVHNLPLSIAGCPNPSATPIALFLRSVTMEPIPQDPAIHESILDYVFNVTYMYYAVIGTLLTMAVGLSVSCVTTEPEDAFYDKDLLHPYVRKLCTKMWSRPRLVGFKSFFADNIIRSTQDLDQMVVGKVDKSYKVQIFEELRVERLEVIKKTSIELPRVHNKV